MISPQMSDESSISPLLPANQQQLDIQPQQLVTENIAWMLKLAERLLQDRGLAEDAVQDAFISAFRGLEKFEQRSSLKTWLHRITVNAALTRLRQKKRRAEQSIDDDLPEFDQYDCRLESPWQSLMSLEEVIESNDLCQRVNESINTLPDSYRIVLQLRDIEGYDTREVAEQLELSEANVKVRLHRARAALKKRLEPILRGEVSI
jgi:RNA polymerase sigma-70 factor (ECF subfamily)